MIFSVSLSTCAIFEVRVAGGIARFNLCARGVAGEEPAASL